MHYDIVIIVRDRKRHEKCVGEEANHFFFHGEWFGDDCRFGEGA